MSINYLFFSLCRHGTLTGALEMVFRAFWDRYLAESRDQGVLETTAPFFAVPRLSVGESALVSEVVSGREANHFPIRRECPGRTTV